MRIILITLGIIVLFLSACHESINQEKECLLYSEIGKDYGGIGFLCDSVSDCKNKQLERLNSYFCQGELGCIKEKKEEISNQDIICEPIDWIQYNKSCNSNEDCVLNNFMKETSRCKSGVCELSEKAAWYHGIIKRD